MDFLRNRYTLVLTAVLLLQAAVYYTVAFRSERVPAMAPLSDFPQSMNEWRMVSDVPVEQEIRDLLKADDLLNRAYASSSQSSSVGLFIAFFKTQRYGQSPHTPKNCLPANGWEEVRNTTISFDVPAWNRPIVTNEYVVEHGDNKSVVLYWYQSHNRVIASEYSAKIWLVLDALRYHRSDTSIVRVIVPVRDGQIDAATEIGKEFIRAMFPQLLKQLPT
ncbi:MAG TPA: EpsI family protein [Bryobacteraceae bacterium]|nr:EpsI family protein [Bryobacteraceae bacterium]